MSNKLFFNSLKKGEIDREIITLIVFNQVNKQKKLINKILKFLRQDNFNENFRIIGMVQGLKFYGKYKRQEVQ